MEKRANGYIISYIISLIILCFGLFCYFGGWVLLPYWVMVVTGIVLGLTYIVIPDMCNKKAAYVPTKNHKYVWYMLWSYDVLFLGILIYAYFIK